MKPLPPANSTMSPAEPINLKEWPLAGSVGHCGRLFTCGRPGRGTYGKERRPVDDDIIDKWVGGLPDAPRLHIVSLLGKKRDGFSEFGYYPFRSSQEGGSRCLTIQQWFDRRYGNRFVVHEFPTTDARGIPADLLRKIVRCVVNLLETSKAVVVVDSMGAERTKRVCERVAGLLSTRSESKPTSVRDRDCNEF